MVGFRDGVNSDRAITQTNYTMENGRYGTNLKTEIPKRCSQGRDYENTSSSFFALSTLSPHVASSSGRALSMRCVTMGDNVPNL
uniref:Uncharacterized protein n=1 Tax=Candidatus Kentrum sp. FW TaxID=2126338 RepID=A0A450SCX9_9GAMM|nr:MAG: hypothetical protein BECKFW1821A_GA0114235_10272 [Candidatus Kentron sp. FW]VFJ55023.1 MAG: hypothetical protein BECKFW1821B_GA0114236_10215 [Candidatus Kentron sp. FW]